MAGGVAQALPTDHTGAFAEENTFSSEITVSADIRFSQENASVNTPPEIKVSSEGLFKAKAVKEVDAERERATPEEVSAEEVSYKTLVMVQTREISHTSSLGTPVPPSSLQTTPECPILLSEVQSGSTGNICLAAASHCPYNHSSTTPPALGGRSCYYYFWRF